MFQTIQLNNGVRIIFEKMPSMRSAAVGIFVSVGSRFESAAENGSAHFIEHMLFKRTHNHSTEELSYIIDGIGGQINAYTTRESTCFYAKVLDAHLDTAIDLLCEMFFDCAFDGEETQSERSVILEEIGMYEDTPDDACYEKLMSGCFKGALGRPVLGKAATLQKMDGESLRAFKNKHYTAGNIVISVCGSFEESHVEKLANAFAVLDKSKQKLSKQATYTQHISVKKKKTEQNQLCLAFPSLSLSNEARFSMNLLSTILGGGVSSRLFQNIREKHGLCYSIYSFQSGFSDTGLFSVATAVSSDTEMKALGLIADEIRRLTQEGVSQEELSRAREQAKSSLVMGLESTSSRMLKLGNALLSLGKNMNTDEILQRYDSVTAEEVLELAQSTMDFSKLSISALGKTAAPEEYLKALGVS